MENTQTQPGEESRFNLLEIIRDESSINGTILIIIKLNI